MFNVHDHEDDYDDDVPDEDDVRDDYDDGGQTPPKLNAHVEL